MLYEYEDAPSEFALNEERNRQARIKAAEDEARAKREADQARRAEVQEAIEGALTSAMDVLIPSTPSDPVPANEDIVAVLANEIMAGRIPHVKVEM